MRRQLVVMVIFTFNGRLECTVTIALTTCVTEHLIVRQIGDINPIPRLEIRS